MVDFDDKLMKAETSEEVRNLKLWMFQERVKIQAKKDELNELSLKLQEEKRTLERDRNALNTKKANMPDSVSMQERILMTIIPLTAVLMPDAYFFREWIVSLLCANATKNF